MHILDDLYNGNINPCERFIKKGSEYQRINRELLKNIEEFLPLLSIEAKQLYEKICEDVARLNYISEKNSFIEGFCIGVKMINEAYTFKSESFD